MIDITITPDEIVLLELGSIELTATVVFAWLVMAILLVLTWAVARNLTTGRTLSRRQNMLKSVVSIMRSQIRELTGQDPERYLPFIGSLFLFVSVSNLLDVVPGYHPPTASINTTAALALLVFLAVPVYGIAERGFLGYMKKYIQPTPLMLPFNIISEFSRTVALAVRLFGNIMSGGLIVAVLVALVPLLVPVTMEIFGLLIGQIQAYIFAVLSTVYIGAGARRRRQTAAGRA